MTLANPKQRWCLAQAAYPCRGDSRITDQAHVFTLDTGFLLEETIRFRKDAMKRYSLPLEVLTPEPSVEEQVERYGTGLYSRKPDLCCQVRKIEPQRGFLRDYGAWSTGIRRDQTEQRMSMPTLSWEKRFGELAGRLGA